MKTNVICYKVKEPIVFNAGSKFETICDTFLFRYTSANDEEALAEVARLNQMLVDDVESYQGENLKAIKEFFLDKQDLIY